MFQIILNSSFEFSERTNKMNLFLFSERLTETINPATENGKHL